MQDWISRAGRYAPHARRPPTRPGAADDIYSSGSIEGGIPAILHRPALPDGVAALEVPFAFRLRRVCSPGRGPCGFLPGKPATLAVRAARPLRPGIRLHATHCGRRQQARCCLGRGGGSEAGSNRQRHDPGFHTRTNKARPRKIPRAARFCRATTTSGACSPWAHRRSRAESARPAASARLPPGNQRRQNFRQIKGN